MTKPKRQSKSPAVIPTDERLPPVNRRVMVVCKSFRCLGYLDREGIWRDTSRLTELTEAIGWYDL